MKASDQRLLEEFLNISKFRTNSGNTACTAQQQ